MSETPVPGTIAEAFEMFIDGRLDESPAVCGNGAAEKAGIDMERQLRVGERVVYVDKYSIPRHALVTVWWDNANPEYRKLHDGEPGCNLVFVSGDPKRKDSCGRQTERETSVVHKGQQPAPGFYWCWPDELTDEQRANLNGEHAVAE